MTNPKDLDEHNCVFCDLSKIKGVTDYGDVVSFEPLNPVTKGHLLVVPKAHVGNMSQSPIITARAMEVASTLAQEHRDCNIITSKGKFATQTVNHLHLHIVPRRKDDGLMLPWSENYRHTSDIKKAVKKLPSVPNADDNLKTRRMWYAEGYNQARDDFLTALGIEEGE